MLLDNDCVLVCYTAVQRYGVVTDSVVGRSPNLGSVGSVLAQWRSKSEGPALTSNKLRASSSFR